MDNLLKQLQRDGVVTFWVKIHPCASRTQEKESMEDGTLKIDVAAPPEKGKANRELISFLAKELGVPKGYVEILCGESARQKQVRATAHYPLRSHELAQLSEIVLGLSPPEREANGEDRFHCLCTIL